MDNDPRDFRQAVLGRICVICPEYQEDGTCHLHTMFDCGVKEALSTLLEPEFETSSGSMSAYVEPLRTAPRARIDDRHPPGSDEARGQSLKRYYRSLVLEAVADEQARCDGELLASAP